MLLFVSKGPYKTAAGYGEQQVLEIILGLSLKIISNYTNHIANPLLDTFKQVLSNLIAEKTS